MNLLVVGYVIGTALLIEGGLMLIPLVCALWYGEPVKPFVIAIAACLVLGFLFRRKKVETDGLLSKEGVVSTGLCWIVVSLTGMLPFLISGSIISPVDAFFETVSGFTTTGSTILTDVEALPRSVLLWRSLMHWIGGMGILVFMLALMPLSGGTQMNLMKAESPGPSISKLVPKASDTARILYAIYGLMTVLTIGLLIIFRMPVFDALCIGFGTAGTGGFGVLNDGCASYSIPQQMVITVMMILFGVNFNFYYLVFLKKVKDAFGMEEVRVYFGILLGAILIIGTALFFTGSEHNILLAFHEAAFHSGSIMTTTGYATVDMNSWPAVARTVIMILMIIGACAGSTGGGLKVSRVMLLIKNSAAEIHHMISPRRVKKVRLDGKVVEDSVLKTVSSFFFLYLFILFVCTFIISFDGFDFSTNFTASLSCISNIGPGLNGVGPTENYYAFSAFSKYVMSLTMLLGRLEIYPIIITVISLVKKK